MKQGKTIGAKPIRAGDDDTCGWEMVYVDKHPWVYPESDFEGLEGSSTVEQSAVNRPVEGSSPSPSAIDLLRQEMLVTVSNYEAAIASKDELIEKLRDENANLRALLPYHEYQGQDK